MRRGGEGIVRRIRSLSRSRSRSSQNGDGNGERPKTIVTVTSCRSDGYYNQKAPGSTSKLPRKAPTNLKLFHELAIGIKDAYAAVGQTPTKPSMEPDEATGQPAMTEAEFHAKSVLWEFIGNIDFLLALVDEVAVDTATRGALKADTTFKGLRDVIKKCNKVLENMLVRRERKYTLFFRLVQPEDTKDIDRIKAWNEKVEKAVGAVTDSQHDSTDVSDSESDASSIANSSTTTSSRASSVFSRGRQLLPVAGRVRARRATPTPTLRKRASDTQKKDSSAAEDGFAASTPVTAGNLATLQQSFQKNKATIPQGLTVNDQGGKSQQQQQQLAPQAQVAPKDELVDVIRGLRMEKMKNREGTQDNELQALKPDWRPKADIPSSVPKLPAEYIHRHRLMKQVVSCLLDQASPTESKENEDVSPDSAAIITSITSRHGDKAGNGKTTLAVAAIQTVEVRERFSDGIAWIRLGRNPLGEPDVRRLYEELYRQLIVKDDNIDLEDMGLDKEDEIPSRGSSFEGSDGQNQQGNNNNNEERKVTTNNQRLANIAISRRRFQGGELEGIKEEIGYMLEKKKVLICLDDVWRVEDAKWFVFDNQLLNGSKPLPKKRDNLLEEYPGRLLITSRTPSLMGNSSLVQEIFVRILSEHEAVKLLLSTAGRRPYGGKNSMVFNQAKLIVKGCGNSPLAVRLAGSMLRHSSRSWNINSPAWSSLINQARLNLEEASHLRSFVNAVNRVVDLSFFTVQDVRTRIVLRRCFVAYAIAFRENDWMLSGRGIPQSVVLRVFQTIISSDEQNKYISASSILDMLEKLNLIERARHGWHARGAINPVREALIKKQTQRASSGDFETDSDWDDEDEAKVYRVQQMFVMHDSLKAVAEEMAKRTTPSLSPDADDFTSYPSKIEEGSKINQESSSLWSAPFRFLANQLQAPQQTEGGFKDGDAHKLVVTSLLDVGEGLERLGSVAEALMVGQLDMAVIAGGEKMEEYMAAFLPWHLMKCEAYTSAAELLSDSHFIGRRVMALGIIEATSRHVADLQELRNLAGNATFIIPPKQNAAHRQANGAPAEATPAVKCDVTTIVRDGSKILVDEVFRVTNKQDGPSDSLGMAMCLAAIGEGLLKSRQPRDALLRLEESVGIYRGLLGSFHTYVADALHTAAKALVKVGETRVALLKFAEAARIYEACNATLHFNSIANAQSLASLLVDLGDMEKAQSMFEEVISMRKTVYGDHCVPVAKTINAYAILLAKHGRMDVALQNYEGAKTTYQLVPPQLVRDPEFEIKCKYDVTLINLNIASIRSKMGDLQEAISCYEDGVDGLREYELALVELQKDPHRSPDVGKNTAHKHLIAALGRIGSLKLKVGDNDGALKAYMTLLEEVKDDSPSASKTEKAKAHIKCATIYRQQDSPDSHVQSIAHLREALNMYTAIFGPDHKDTAAIASSLRQWLAEDQQ
eukprot:Nitzschia sp. Nitz4//scaffold15_size197535//57988//62594//NITZ4_001570-RA/size197535-augustus-gene-0.223-mRNA-1//-1//CDS//3329537691//6776//frame0